MRELEVQHPRGTAVLQKLPTMQRGTSVLSKSAAFSLALAGFLIRPQAAGPVHVLGLAGALLLKVRGRKAGLSKGTFSSAMSKSVPGILQSVAVTMASKGEVHGADAAEAVSRQWHAYILGSTHVMVVST